jgi:hypothetical protein
VTGLQSIRRHIWVLPLLLGALALRAFLPGAGTDPAGLQYDSRMCSQVERGEIETQEAPGEEEFTRPHCEYCVAPLLGAPLADSLFRGHPPLAERAAVPLVSQIPDAPLARTQRARAPPRA